MSRMQDRQGEFRLALVVEPKKLHGVRHDLADRLASWGLVELVDDSLKIATELLTNAYRHAGGRAVLFLQMSSGLLRITVSDRSHELPVIQCPDWMTESGRGMALVASLASELRVVPTADGKDVEVTLVCHPPAAGTVVASRVRCTA
ncbi:ATP-binding protein [Streptomyces sp. WZ-12]|uniref:ATP-binding protein n=1 Tax=Streptomyces sp. WZ-12 TaxID=3030210 RepID=UPI002380F2D2|nr:ATP-binding protein [Streptomyces sp. WZ-12]